MVLTLDLTKTKLYVRKIVIFVKIFIINFLNFQVKAENPSFSICEIAKELGRRWAEMGPEVKQQYQQLAEEGRQKYDRHMAVYRQGNSQ